MQDNISSASEARAAGTRVVALGIAADSAWRGVGEVSVKINENFRPAEIVALDNECGFMGFTILRYVKYFDEFHLVGDQIVGGNRIQFHEEAAAV